MLTFEKDPPEQKKIDDEFDEFIDPLKNEELYFNPDWLTGGIVIYMIPP